MSLLLKAMKGSERRLIERREKRCQREALTRREDPTIYQVKQKLMKHHDLCYSSMSEEDLAREATQLTDPEYLKQFFSDITDGPTKKTHREESAEIGQNVTDKLTNPGESYRNQRDPGGIHWNPGGIHNGKTDKVGQLTLKLHLRRLDETPSVLTRFGIALFKIPYGVLHASLEIGDSCNTEVTYIVEFNTSSLVQPRRKNRNEDSALEATVHLGGSSLVKMKRTDLTSSTPARNQGSQGGRGQCMMHDLSYVCQVGATLTRDRQHNEILCAGNRVNIIESGSEDDPSLPPVPRPRSKCMRSRMAPVVRRKVTSHHDCNMTEPESCQASHQQDIIKIVATDTQKQETTHIKKLTPTEDRNLIVKHMTSHTAPTPSLQPQEPRNSPNTEHLMEDELAMSKILLINKLVSIIVKYNRYYYYQSITQNCQTFVVDVLQSFGVWEDFKLGDKLDQYVENLTKGRQEVYKSHKSVNDRVKYLVVSGEIHEITYGEARYLRSLYTIYHREEAPNNTTAASQFECSDRECMFKDLEQRLNEIRPVGAMILKSPEHYM